MSESWIRIVSTPPGDAPLWVREKWVGLDLPLVDNERRRGLGISVNVKYTALHHLWAMLCGRFERISGYRVEARRAVDILAGVSPEAADWWRQNTPAILRPGGLFMFHAEACRLNVMMIRD